MSSRLRIYAGETPLALSIRVERTGPMQLTVRAGSYTSTGRSLVEDYQPELHDRALRTGWGELIALPARVAWPVLDERGGIVAVEGADYDPEAHDALLDEGQIALVPARARVRLWQSDGERARTYVLAGDQVLDVPDAGVVETWRGVLITTALNAGTELVNVLLQSRVGGADDYPALPAGWALIHPLIGDFTVLPGAAALPELNVWTVIPGYPAATEPEDWHEQRGDTGGGPVVLPVQILALGRAFTRARKLVPV
jgi:hypothetical protein